MGQHRSQDDKRTYDQQVPGGQVFEHFFQTGVLIKQKKEEEFERISKTCHTIVACS